MTNKKDGANPKRTSTRSGTTSATRSTTPRTRAAARQKLPTKTLLQGMEYICAEHTDVQATWRRFGWVPPSEAKGGV